MAQFFSPSKPYFVKIQLVKSAYELAMARIEKVVPAVTLTEEQKSAITAINIRMDAAIAEKKILLESELSKAAPHEQEAIRHQLASELRRIEEKREHEKEKVRAPRKD
jgi:hypothetical protein